MCLFVVCYISQSSLHTIVKSLCRVLPIKTWCGSMRSRNRGGGGTNEGRKEGRRRGIKYWCMDQVHVYALM